MNKRKLIIQNKAWGEFENMEQSDGDVIIKGYRCYGGTHTVRPVDNPDIELTQREYEIIQVWGNVTAGEFSDEWTEDDELFYRKMYGQSLMTIPGESGADE